MKQYLIFDFDGVLVDSFDLGIDILRKTGHDISPEQWKAHHDGNVFETPAVDFTEESRNAFREGYFKNICSCHPFFDAQILEQLSKKYTLHIISSNREYSIEKFLNFHHLNFFEEVLGGDFHKSKVEKFKYLFEKYNFGASGSYFISDTLGDILEGNQVGVQTLALDFGFHERERLEKGKPFQIFSSVEELLRFLEN